MHKYTTALFCALLVLSLIETINCGKFGGGRGFGRGGGSHSYPSSHGLSGTHKHPSGGLSGGHGYPSSGGSHSYPSSHGSSGSSNSHGYPASGGLSGGSGYPSSSGGKHAYPSSGSGLSGSQSHGYPASKPNHPQSTTINNHYHYSPPQQISYASPGHRPVSYPVYQGTPPTYVYQYKDSGSKYGALLTGLALLNLGTLAGVAYAGSRSHSNGQTGYKAQPGEVCKFAVKKQNGDYEETRIDCQLITSFIFQEEAKASADRSGTNTTTVTTSVTNVTMINATNPAEPAATTTTPPSNVLYQMLPNGTLVPVNVTLPANVTLPGTNATDNANSTNASTTDGVTSSVIVTTTTTNTTVVNALDVKGKEIDVTPGMECFVIRNTPVTNMRKHISCGLLQTYATQSLKKNSAIRNIPTFTLLFAVAALVLH